MIFDVIQQQNEDRIHGYTFGDRPSTSDNRYAPSGNQAGDDAGGDVIAGDGFPVTC